MCLRVDIDKTRKIKKDIKNFQFYKEFSFKLDDNGIRFRSPFQGSKYDLPGTFYEDDAFTKERIKEIQTEQYYSLSHKCLHVYCLSKDKKTTHTANMYNFSQYNFSRDRSFSCNGTVMIDIVVKPQNFIAADIVYDGNAAAVTEFTISAAVYKRVIKLIKEEVLPYKDKISNYDKIMKILK